MSRISKKLLLAFLCGLANKAIGLTSISPKLSKTLLNQTPSIRAERPLKPPSVCLNVTIVKLTGTPIIFCCFIDRSAVKYAMKVIHRMSYAKYKTSPDEFALCHAANFKGYAIYKSSKI